MLRAGIHNLEKNMSGFTLADLHQLGLDCRAEYSVLPSYIDIKIENKLKDLLVDQLSRILKGEIDISLYSIKYTNEKNQVSILPSKWLWAASIFHKYSYELSKYMEIVKEAKSSTDLKQYPKDSEPATKTPEDLSFETEAQNILIARDSVNSSVNFLLFKKYIYNKEFSYFENEGRKLDRPDVYSSSILSACQFIAASSDKFIPLVKAFEQSEELRNEFSEHIKYIIAGRTIKSSSNTKFSRAGENTIYYGAPGTGKSHAINEKTDANNAVRTVFHPDTQYSDFVGCLRPSMGADGIEYSYKHGPFIEALVKALNDPDHQYYLIIEELNRAPAAAVFGEIFQLLDRNNGKSQYEIDINDKDLAELLNRELSTPLSDRKLYIPANLSILATMNSSDQAVLPLDTAFKRRWKFKYIPICFEDAAGKPTCATGTIEFQTNNGPEEIEWSELAQTINSILSAESIPEDRHLGPWFISQDELTNPDGSSNPTGAQECFTGKILMYLWDDVLRHGETSKLFHKDIKTFGGLVSAHQIKKQIFSDNFYALLEVKYPIKSHSATVVNPAENTPDA
jgi:hypothetical protein